MARTPLFYAALFLLLGTAWALSPSWALFFPTALLFYFTRNFKWGSILLIGAAVCTLWRCPPSLMALTEKEGSGIFTLTCLKAGASPFGKYTQAQGTLKGVDGFPKIPCTLRAKKIPKKGHAWRVSGTLLQTRKGMFTFKADELTQAGKKSTLARWRSEKKEAVRRFIQKRWRGSRSIPFLSAMATGEVTSPLLSSAFRKVGLGHILAISGFHFALFATLIGGALRLFLPLRVASLGVLLALTFLFLYYGPTPSIARAYAMITFFLFGLLIERRGDPLNFLGGALIIELLISPLSLFQVGFQLSYLATAGIFLYCHPLYRGLERVFPRRGAHAIREMPLLDKHLLLIGKGLHGGLSLQLGVLIATLPVSLALFGTFPLLSIPYNLLFAPLLSLTLFTFPFALLPPIQKVFDPFVSYVLTLIENPPELLHFQLLTPAFPGALAIFLSTAFLFLGLTKRGKRSENGVVFRKY